MIAVDEDSADGLPAVAGVRVLNECGPWEHGAFTMQSRQKGRWGKSRNMSRNVGASGFAISTKKTTWRVLSCKYHYFYNYVGAARFHDLGCKRTCSPFI